MVDIDQFRDTLNYVIEKAVTVPDETGLLFIDENKLRAATQNVIDLIGPVSEPSGFARVQNIERQLDILLNDLHRYEQMPTQFYTSKGVPIKIETPKETKETFIPTLKPETPKEPVKASSGISEEPQVVVREAISSKLLGVSPLTAELVRVEEKPDAFLTIKRPVDEYLSAIRTLSENIVSDIDSISPSGLEPVSYVSPERLADIQAKTAALTKAISIIPDTGKIEFIPPGTIQKLQEFNKELERARALSETQYQYVKVQSYEDYYNIPPEDLDGQRAAAKDALDRLWKDNPGGRATELLAYHFPGLTADIITGRVDGLKVLESINFYEALHGGYASEIQRSRFANSSGVDLLRVRDSFDKVGTEEKKARLLLCWKEIINDTADPYIALTLTAQLAQSAESDNVRSELSEWLSSGEFDKKLNEDSSWTTQMKIRDFALTPQGQATGALLFTGAVSILSAGLGLATVSVGTLASGIFAATEVPNLIGFLEYKQTQENIDTGRDPSSVSYNYKYDLDSVERTVNDLLFNADQMDPDQRKTALDLAKSEYDKLGQRLFTDWWALQSTGQYDSALNSYKSIGQLLDRISEDINPETGEVSGALAPPEFTYLVTVPKGMHAEYNGKILPEGQTTPIVEKSGTIGAIKMSQPGYNPDTLQLRFYGEGEANVTLALKEQWGKEAEALRESGSTSSSTPSSPGFFDLTADKSSTTQKGYVLYLEPGQTAEMAGKKYVGKEDMPTKYLLFGHIGDRLSIRFTQPGMEDKVVNYYLQDTGPVTISQPLEKSFTESLKETQKLQEEYAAKKRLEESRSYLVPQLSSGQTLYLNGKRVEIPADGSPVVITPGTYGYVIKESGKPDITGSFQIFGGDTRVIGGTAKSSSTSSYMSSGGGGGGGGVGRTYITQKITQYPSTPTQKDQSGYIKFTSSATAGRIWIDDVEVHLNPGQLYNIDQGYHSIRMELDGKLPWTKLVYVGGGDTITVSPLWEDDPNYGKPPDAGPVVFTLPTKKRVYIDSRPTSAKVLLNGLATGQWTPCYLDLDPGYYVLGFVKSGYLQTEQTLFVGDTIAWGELADSLAIAAGLI